MRTTLRFLFCAAAVVVAVCGAANAQELAPPGSNVSIQKLVIESASSRTVKYYVKGGSPRLQALVRRVEWAENELTIVEQLQMLKLDTVVNERRIAAVRGAQLTNPDYLPGFIPFPIATVNGRYRASPLQRNLEWQLAQTATPAAALQLIGYLERQQTQLDAELKALPPQEKKAAQGPIDDLRARVAALPHGDDPAPPPQPAAPQPVRFPAPAVPQKAQVEVEWHGTWWPAEVVKTNGDRSFIHYTGWADSWDEWVGPDRIRR